MVRTIITPTDTHINLLIPNGYVGKPIEITFLALEELEQKHARKPMADFWGTISDETAHKMHEQLEQSRS